MPKTSFEEECERLVLETKGVRSNPEDNQLENKRKKVEDILARNMESMVIESNKDQLKTMENKDWREELRDLYLKTSPDLEGFLTKKITFEWGEFDFTQRQETAEFYLTTKNAIERFIQSLLDKQAEKQREKEGLLPYIYCEQCGTTEYLLEEPHHDANGKIFSDIVCKRCSLVIATFHKDLTNNND